MQHSQDNIFTLTVAEIMTRTPKVVSPTTKIDQIQLIMHKNKIHSVLVVDDNGHLLGVVDHFSCML
jgi:arabinose-5-phosphate isomerase